MKSDDFSLFARMLKEQSGLVLTSDKAYLLESRLLPVARNWNLKGLDEMAAKLRMRPDPTLVRDITEAMTTNESSFFRDMKPFDQLRDVVLPRLMEARRDRRRIRIWSAACSSGQEPYTIAIVLKEMAAKLSGWSFDIIATDISGEMVDRCKEGSYSQFEVQRGLPITLLVKYFKQAGDRWQVSQELKSMVQFRTWNLLQDPRAFGTFDVVFCRNVLIYFDQPTKAKVLGSISTVMANDGMLYLGGAETVLGVTSVFKPLERERGLYVMSNDQSAAGRAPLRRAVG